MNYSSGLMVITFAASCLMAGCSPAAIPPAVDVGKVCYIESVPPASFDTGQPLPLKGWAFLPALGGPAPAVAVRFERGDGLVYQRPLLLSGERPDVAVALHVGDTHVGAFEQSIDLTRIVSGRYVASVVQFVDGHTYTCATSFVLSVR
ncbi:hypothetical protein [Dyella subtropica]|uniref:hypothetical protein n=1 Tax=Dyella subtropica TaxID=2992127 RepID=UPI00225265D8|nr:hypothetical protein [Dyella subtropica]